MVRRAGGLDSAGASCVSSSVPSPAGSSAETSGISGAAVVVVVCPGLSLRLILFPGLTGLGPVPGSLARTLGLAVVLAS